MPERGYGARGSHSSWSTGDGQDDFDYQDGYTQPARAPVRQPGRALMEDINLDDDVYGGDDDQGGVDGTQIVTNSTSVSGA